MRFFVYTLAVDASCPEEDLAALQDLWPAECLSSSFLRMGNDHRRHWVVSWLMDDENLDPAETHQALMNVWRHLYPDRTLPLLSFLERSVLADRNWLEYVYQSMPGMGIGPFWIRGSHDTAPPRADKISLVIDAATAFGSGEHGTTRGCLESLAFLVERLPNAPRAVLDMGTGSGILAIAAAKLWSCPIIATDCDPEALRVTAHHAGLNNLPSGRLQCVLSDTVQCDAVLASAPYDVVLANILAAPLKDMAPDLCAVTAPAGYLVLSGFLTHQEPELMNVYSALGMQPAHRIMHEDWVALTLEKKG